MVVTSPFESSSPKLATINVPMSALKSVVSRSTT
jgi:hypothetical protein